MDQTSPLTSGLNVILTGSTGNFGSYILDSLLNDTAIASVTCLNRSTDALQRQRESHKERALTTDFNKVSFHQADFSHEHLGIAENIYASLSHSVDLVIHNAWPVDFNRKFQSFHSSIQGVQHMIDFCSRGRARLVFISSVGATSNWGAAAPSARSKIPEVELTDWKVARTGYGQSKLVSERLVSHAAKEMGISALVVRVGQLGGPVEHGEANGKWTEREWVPSLIRSSIALGAVPRNLGPANEIDWVPVDTAARILVELCLCPASRTKTGGAGFFHLVNPHSTPWQRLVPAITTHVGPSLSIISFEEWVRLLKESSSTLQPDANPAIKLIEFFENLCDRAVRFPRASATLLDTKHTVKASATMADLGPVRAEWMELWMRQWGWVECDGASRA